MCHVFFFNDTAPTEIYTYGHTLSLHAALPILAGAHERLQPLLDVRHDHQRIDDRIGRLGGDDARLGDADVAIAAATLLGVGDGGTLHRSFHRARAAAGADIQTAQRSEEHTSELQSLMRISYAAFSLKKTHSTKH